MVLLLCEARERAKEDNTSTCRQAIFNGHGLMTWLGIIMAHLNDQAPICLLFYLALLKLKQHKLSLLSDIYLYFYNQVLLFLGSSANTNQQFNIFWQQ